MRDRTFVVQMMMLAVGLALMWTWALQTVDSNDHQRRTAAVLDRARQAAAEEVRSTAPIRNAPNSTTSSSLIEPAPGAEAPARASIRERIIPSKS
jgi:hypothetical protein